ncbi:MAG: type II toxin-antitoxin system RelE/ParE family toxin [Pseudanabaena sp. ELA607]
MVYQIEISPSAIADIENIYIWLRDEFPAKADEWYNNLVKAILSLEKFPSRCPLALENKDFDRETRQLIYKKHRIIFGVNSDVVQIYRVRHVAQDTLTADDL